MDSRDTINEHKNGEDRIHILRTFDPETGGYVYYLEGPAAYAGSVPKYNSRWPAEVEFRKRVAKHFGVNLPAITHEQKESWDEEDASLR